MNKADLIDAISGTVGDKRTASVAVEAVLATVQRAVAAGEKVSVPGFGVFEKVDRAARTARNPATGEPVELEASSVPRFRPGQRFKDVVRGAAAPPELPEPAPRPAARVAAAPAPVAAQEMAQASAPQPAPAAPAAEVSAPKKGKAAPEGKKGKAAPGSKKAGKDAPGRKKPGKGAPESKKGKKDGKAGRKK